VPLKLSAFPYLPVVAHVAFEIVPLLPLPEESVTVVPEPSSNPYAATSPLAEAAARVVVPAGRAPPAAAQTRTRAPRAPRPANARPSAGRSPRLRRGRSRSTDRLYCGAPRSQGWF